MPNLRLEIIKNASSAATMPAKSTQTEYSCKLFELDPQRIIGRNLIDRFADLCTNRSEPETDRELPDRTRRSNDEKQNSLDPEPKAINARPVQKDVRAGQPKLSSRCNSKWRASG